MQASDSSLSKEFHDEGITPVAHVIKLGLKAYFIKKRMPLESYIKPDGSLTLWQDLTNISD